MSDKAKAKKLAAAKRKLKEYHQLKGKQQINLDGYEDVSTINESKTDNMSESGKSEDAEKGSIFPISNEKLDFNSEPEVYQKESKSINSFRDTNGAEGGTQLEAIELIIAEKASLSTQVGKLQTSCKQKDLEIEELNTMLKSARNRIESLEKTTTDQNFEISNLRSSVEEMRNHLSNQENNSHKFKTQCGEQADYIEELKHELSLGRTKIDELEAELKEKSCKLELYNIRINQISEEASVATDNRIEDLTQAKFVHEQQIRDLEALVKQLNVEKEQASQQYQNYTQYLNKEVTTLRDKNLELMNEQSKLLDREKTMVDHIAQLEKQIQDNIARQEVLKSNGNSEANAELETTNSELKHKIEDLQQQCNNLDATIKLQDSKIQELNVAVEEKQLRIEDLEKLNDQLKQSQPDSAKLLASIESDKVAASRAVAQNEELKKQLEEIQLKLIQVTNEKVELVEHLHSEQHANKEVRANFDKMCEDLKQNTEKLHFKDEEMIRLTHENNELNKKILQLNQQVDRLMHYEAKEYTEKYVDNSETNNNIQHSQDCSHSHSHDCEEDPKHEHNIMEKAMEALEADSASSTLNQNLTSRNDRKISTDLPTGEAMVKLQERFTTLISEVADLTDEKQRLEHLVLQLQGETETIGEYIALYQTQRRMLKQKEIEKNTHLQRLLAEREEMKEKIIELTQLITSLEVKSENPKKIVIQEKIHNIITEIKEKDNLEPPSAGCVDHCACCSGKFETI